MRVGDDLILVSVSSERYLVSDQACYIDGLLKPNPYIKDVNILSFSSSMVQNGDWKHGERGKVVFK